MQRIVSPVDGELVAEVPYLRERAAREKVQAAREAQQLFSDWSLERRIELCRKALSAFEDSLGAHARAISMMMGKPLLQAQAEFLSGVRERVESLIAEAPAALAEQVQPTLLPESSGAIRRFIRREPLGVVLDIAAWNYPLLIVVNVLFPSILSGNAVLIKHAAQTALVGKQFEEAFAKAGAPSALVQDFFVSHQTLSHLFEDGIFDGVSFTGSVRGGREVAQAVARQSFRQAGFELGGKDAAYVAADAQIEFTAENLADAAFYNAGQSCCGVERIYVHQAVYDEFNQAFAAQMRKLVIGHPLDERTTLGPLVGVEARILAEEQVGAALLGGARDLVSRDEFVVPDISACFMAPRALIDAAQDPQLMQKESFAPIVGIQAVRDDRQAISRVNDSLYGLTASVWSDDDERALKVAEALEVGTVFQNRADYLDPGLAWTGVKQSGAGVSLSALGFQQLTRPKSFHLRSRT